MLKNIGLISGVVELLVSIVLGVLVAFIAFRTFRRTHQELSCEQSLKDNNVAMAVVLGSMIVGTGLVAAQALNPVISTLQTTLYAGLTVKSGFSFLGLTLVYLALALFLAIGGITVSTKLFLWMTAEIDELAEVMKNNVAVAITLAAVIVVMSLFLSHGTRTLLNAMVPYQAMGNIQVMGE